MLLFLENLRPTTFEPPKKPLKAGTKNSITYMLSLIILE
jgi:hypothetical protein